MKEEAESRQISLVAFYGNKKMHPVLHEKIVLLHKILEDKLPGNFEKYDPVKIHGTIIGLEAAKFDNTIINKNFLENQHKILKTDLLKILEYVQKSDLFPIDLKLGGFVDKDELFTSRGESPYTRSFSIQGNIVVMKGWPFTENKYSTVLDTLRRRLNKFGALHKYHPKPDSFDNDFFFVLGKLTANVPKEYSKEISDQIRNEMKSWKNTFIKLTKDDLKTVAYKDTELNDALSRDIKTSISEIDYLKKYYPYYEDAVKDPDWLVN